MRRCYHSNGIIDIIVMIIIGLIAIPFVGVYIIAHAQDSFTRWLGIGVLVVGIFILTAMGA